MPGRTREVPGNAAPAGRRSDFETELAQGRRGEMPFLLVGGTAVVVIGVAAVLAGALLLVWWLS
jgi:hypothetical protein